MARTAGKVRIGDRCVSLVDPGGTQSLLVWPADRGDMAGRRAGDPLHEA